MLLWVSSIYVQLRGELGIQEQYSDVLKLFHFCYICDIFRLLGPSFLPMLFSVSKDRKAEEKSRNWLQFVLSLRMVPLSFGFLFCNCCSHHCHRIAWELWLGIRGRQRGGSNFPPSLWALGGPSQSSDRTGETDWAFSVATNVYWLGFRVPQAQVRTLCMRKSCKLTRRLWF